MLTLNANFNGETKSLNVMNITMKGSLHLEDGSYVSKRTIEILQIHPELILRQKNVTTSTKGQVTFWE